jgi:hypothetical protein
MSSRLGVGVMVETTVSNYEFFETYYALIAPKVGEVIQFRAADDKIIKVYRVVEVIHEVMKYNPDDRGTCNDVTVRCREVLDL